MKKIKSVLITFMVAASILLPAIGCKDKGCKHDVSAWEVITPATCAEKGLQEGICGICLQTVQEAIPKDPDNHPYGEWVISATPTETLTGSATKTCTANKEHTLTITLPTLSSIEYLSTITTRPTAGADGVRTYTLKHATGNVEFTQSVPATGVQTLRDAVDLGVAEESRALVRSAEGSMGYKKYEDGLAEPSVEGGNFKHSYEFCQDYTHIVEEDLGTGDVYNRWYFKDAAEELYGLTDRNGEGKILNDLLDTSSNEKYLNGSRIYIAYYGGANTFGYAFGVEDFLDRLYRTARMSTNGDFQESIAQKDGKTVYSFSYGEAQNSGENSGYFTVTTASFVLGESFTIENLDVQSVTYVNNSGGASNIQAWHFDEGGYARVNEGKEGSAERYVTDIHFAQTLKAATDVEKQNPHALDKIFVQSFDIRYNEDILQEGDYAEFAAGEEVNTGYIFSIANVQPASAIDIYTLDSFSFYLRTKNELGETVDLPIGGNTISTIGMTAYMDPSTHQFFLRAQRAGEQTVVVKTKFAEKEIHCKIAEEEPKNIYPTFYRYENGEYVWDYRTDTLISLNTTVTHYVYQPFYFTADVPEDQKNYASASYNYEIKKGSVLVSEDLIVHTSIGERAVVEFTPIETGTYNIVITSKSNSKIKSTVYFKVSERPAFTDLTDKEYERRLEYPQPTTASVVFTNRAELTAVVEGQTVTTGYTVYATVTLEDGSFQTLSCVYDLETRELTSQHLSGNASLGFVLGLNEASDFILSHPDGFGELEKVLLLQKEAATPSA